MARICKSINAGSRLEVASNWEEREWGVTANAHWGFFWGGGKNVLELGSSDGYTIQWIYLKKKYTELFTLNEWILWHVNL